jgi:hypothetical protein
MPTASNTSTLLPETLFAAVLRFAWAGEVANREVDDLAGIAEVRGAHAFRIKIGA